MCLECHRCHLKGGKHSRGKVVGGIFRVRDSLGYNLLQKKAWCAHPFCIIKAFSALLALFCWTRNVVSDRRRHDFLPCHCQPPDTLLPLRKQVGKDVHSAQLDAERAVSKGWGGESTFTGITGRLPLEKACFFPARSPRGDSKVRSLMYFFMLCLFSITRQENVQKSVRSAWPDRAVGSAWGPRQGWAPVFVCVTLNNMNSRNIMNENHISMHMQSPYHLVCLIWVWCSLGWWIVSTCSLKFHSQTTEGLQSEWYLVTIKCSACGNASHRTH